MWVRERHGDRERTEMGKMTKHKGNEVRNKLQTKERCILELIFFPARTLLFHFILSHHSYHLLCSQQTAKGEQEETKFVTVRPEC